MHFLSIGLIAGVLCAVGLSILIRLAPKLGLIDMPDGRKRHPNTTPVVGGIAIYMSLLGCSALISGFEVSWSLLFWFGLVLAVGVLDDKLDISYSVRIFVHAAAVFGVFMTDGLVVNDIGAIFGGQNVDFFGPIAILFTGFGIIGAINSTNMMDGLDGLLGSLILVSLVAIFGLAAFSGIAAPQSLSLYTISALIGALISFLWLNFRVSFRPTMVFLGDAGSTLLGFILAYILIEFSQGSSSVFSPVLAGWLLGLPLVDSSVVIARRVLEGRSPFKPDRMHLHHRLIDSGMSVQRTVLTMVAIHASLITVGISVSFTVPMWSDMLLFWGFVLLVLLQTSKHPSMDFVKALTVGRPGSRSL
jgi:UDP-GlcNAc:undecaprenyl-phosphate GlcNAc-1-phosphate transferase